MNRKQLEHLIREIGHRLQLECFHVSGSAAVFASIPEIPDAPMIATRDVVVIPAIADEPTVKTLADRIDIMLGEGSDFAEENGFYVQGVENSTPDFAPKGWRERVIPVHSGGFTGLCMEIHDLAISKYGAGREKDLDFTRLLAKGGYTQKSLLFERLKEVEADRARLGLIRQRIDSDFS